MFWFVVTVELDADFITPINSNLNTSEALALAHQNKNNLLNYDQVLGLNLKDSAKTEDIEVPQEVKDLLDQRATAREEKDFTKSDELRDKIAELGYEVKDTANGQIITK